MSNIAASDTEKDIRAGAEIIYGAENCYNYYKELLKTLGFPEGIFHLKNLDELGVVRETGFVWMKQKEPSEHFFQKANYSKVRYNTEMTSYVENGKITKMTGVRTKEMLLWVPIVEMSIEEGNKICIKTSLGAVRSYPLSVFGHDMETKSVEAMRPTKLKRDFSCYSAFRQLR